MTPANHGALVIGAKMIAAIIGANERQVFYWADTGALPLTRIGRRLCISREALTRWVAMQERER